MLSWSDLFFISEWVVRLVMLVVVTRRRQPSTAMAWLLVIFFEPWIGLVLYLLVGTYRLPRRRTERHAKLREHLKAIGRRFHDHPIAVRPRLRPESMATVDLAERLGDMPIVGGNSVELLTETDEAIDRLVADIDAARKHVHLLFYIYADDATGRRVAEALGRAVARDVTCRVLVDAVGSRPMLKRLAPRMVQQGVQLHPMLPVGLFRRRVSRMDLRNHRKLAVIDGETAYTGSQNIVDADYGHKDLAWHDMMLRLRGPVLLELQAVFMEDWYFETNEILATDGLFPEPLVEGDIPVQTLPSGPDYPTENYQRLVVAAIHAARQRVIITTPYLVPDEALMQAIEVAGLRGVEVDVIVPQRCDQILVGAASRAYYHDLLDVGARIYLHGDGLLHAKTISIDDAIALIGSSNFDIRSFALNFEINMLLYGTEITERLRRAQNLYLEQSRRLEADQWRARPAARQIFDNIARLLSPLL